MSSPPLLPRDDSGATVPLLPWGSGQTPQKLTATGTANNIVSNAIDATWIWVYCDTEALLVELGAAPDARDSAGGAGRTGKPLSAGLWQFPIIPGWKIAIAGPAGATVTVWPAATKTP